MQSPQSRTCNGLDGVLRAGVGGQNHSLLRHDSSASGIPTIGPMRHLARQADDVTTGR
jgi:hypothetical protein